MNEIKILKVRQVKTPTRGTDKSAGIDFFIPDYEGDFLKKIVDKNENLDEHNFAIDYDTTEVKFYILIKKGGNILIPSGIKVIIPENYAFISFNKSSVAFKKDLMVGACIVDEDYRGEVHINLINASNKDVRINFGEKICQFILVPTIYSNIKEIKEKEYNKYENTERKEGGFGSTNIKDK